MATTYTTIGGDVRETGLKEGEVIRRRKRWDPLKPGTFMLATVKVVGDSDGIVWKEGKGGYLGFDVDLHYVVEPGARGSTRRPIRQRIVTKGIDHVVAEGKGILMRILSCHMTTSEAKEKLAEAHTLIDGLVVAIMLGEKPHHSTGAPVQTALVLCPDPRSSTADRYVDMVRLRPSVRVVRHEIVDGQLVEAETCDYMPGWRLHPGTPAWTASQKVIAKEQKDRDEKPFELKRQSLRGPRGSTDNATIARVVEGPDRMIETMAASNAARQKPQEASLPSKVRMQHPIAFDAQTGSWRPDTGLPAYEAPSGRTHYPPKQPNGRYDPVGARLWRDREDEKVSLKFEERMVAARKADKVRRAAAEDASIKAIADGRDTMHLAEDHPDWCPF